MVKYATHSIIKTGTINPIKNDSAVAKAYLQNDKRMESQKTVNLALVKEIKSADTILITSHSGNTFDTVKSKEIFPQLLIGNRINYKIIKEKKILIGSILDSLTKILLMPVNEDDIILPRCCDPHHTIFIITKGKVSYINLCFHCFCQQTSKDLELIKGYDEPKWMALLSFFKTLGFKYQMPDK